MKTTQFWAQVKYILGSPSNVSDLQKASISTAQAVFLVTSCRFLDAEQELAADEETLLRAISIKHFCPYVPLIMHILSPRNKAHVLWYQLSKFPNIQVVCLNEMKMRLFASSCMCPGVMGLVTNLLSSYDGKGECVDAVFRRRLGRRSRHGTARSSPPPHRRMAPQLSNARRSPSPPGLSPQPARPPTRPPPSHRRQPMVRARCSSFHLRDGAGRRSICSASGRRYYTAEFPECVDGYSFAEVAAVLYERLQIVLIGVYQADEATGKAAGGAQPRLQRPSASERRRSGVCDRSERRPREDDQVGRVHPPAQGQGRTEHGHTGTGGRGRGRRDRLREQLERDKRQLQKRERLQRRVKRQHSQRAKFAHTIDIPHKPKSARNLNVGPMQAQQDDEKDGELDTQQPTSTGSRELDGDGAMSPSWPLSEEDAEQELGVLDALSSFRCNGQPVVPSMPASSYIAQLNVAEQEEERRLEEEDARQLDEARTEGSPPDTNTHDQPPPGRGRQLGDLSDEVVEKHTGNAVNPVTGQITGHAAQPSLVERVMEGVGLGASRQSKEAEEEEKQQAALDEVVSEHPELADGGQHASAEEEDEKDAAVFSPAGQKQAERGQQATSDSSAPPADQVSSSPPSTTTSAPATTPSTPPRQPPTHNPPSRSPTSPPHSNTPSSPKVDYADLDPYTGHIVVCGYIDSKIINFLRRLRDSDSRTVVLVFDNSVCFALPPAVHAFIVTHFENVYILFASSTYKARHQKDRLYLAYTSPCYGHHHEPPTELAERDQKRPVSAVANAASVDGAPSELTTGTAATQPPLAMDEHSEYDKRVHHALHLSGEVGGPPIKEFDDETSRYQSALADHRRSASSTSSGNDRDGGDSGSSSSYPNVAAYSLSIDGAEGSKPMTYEEMLQHGSWFRRACLHRADSVLILANPYSSPAGSSSSSSSFDNPQASMTQWLLASIMSATDRQSNSSTDEMLKADQFGLTIYSGIQAYLQQCRTAACPSLSMHVTATTFSIVNIELVHHSNVRLLKHDADTTEKYRPTQAVEAGWRWLWDAGKHWYEQHKQKSQVKREKLAVRRKMKKKRQTVKRRHFAMMRGVALKDEEKLDRASTDESTTNDGHGGSDDEDENEEKKDRGGDANDTGMSAMDQTLREEDARFAKTLQEHFRAFYTADGLMFSGKILDALIVQAFFHPLVYDTVVSLVSGYAHTIPEQQFQRAMDERDSVTGDGGHSHGQSDSDSGAGGRGEGDGEAHKGPAEDPNDRTFRVELLLVDVPAVMAGRTYGFLALKLMLENGWVPLGLYRDRRAVVRLRQKTRLKAMLLEKAQREGNQQSHKQSKSSSRRHSTSQSSPAARPAKPVSPPTKAPSRPPSGAASRRSSLANSSVQLVSKQSSKGMSAIELAEQQRRQQSFHVRGLSGNGEVLRLGGSEMTAQQREEERRTEHLARRTDKLHRRHPHSRTPTPNPPPPPETANVNTRTTDSGNGSLGTHSSEQRPSVSDAFTVQVATTLGKESNDGSVRVSHHHHHHHHHHAKQGTTALGTHAEHGGEYDADNDADHLDTSAQQHRDMIQLRQDTFEPPRQQKQQQQATSTAEEKRRERIENTTVTYARSDQEDVTKAQQDYMYHAPHHSHAALEQDHDDCCSSESSCSSESPSDDGGDQADEAELTNTPYTSRSLFYVLTNPPPDTILHARDRLYVLVQRWIKPASVHRMLNGQSMKEAEEAVNREQQDEEQRTSKDGNSHRSGPGSPDNRSSPDDNQPVSPSAMAFPRTYSGDGQAVMSNSQQSTQPSQPSQQGPGGNEQSVVSSLQQQLAQQQQMLQSIQRQLADLASAQSGQTHRRQPKSASAHGTPTASGYSTPAAQDGPGPSQLPLPTTVPSFASANSRYQMPAEDETISYELQRFMSDRPGPVQHPPLRRTHSTQSASAAGHHQAPAASAPSYGTLVPIAGATHFGRSTGPKRGSSGHISITDASPSSSTYSSSSSLLPQFRTISGDFGSLLPASSSAGGLPKSSSSTSLFSHHFASGGSVLVPHFRLFLS